MSRIREALKKADGESWHERPSLTANPVPFGLPVLKSDRPIQTYEPEAPANQEIRPAATPITRLVRRIKRLLGMRIGGPAARCEGITRQGLPCKGLAMPNGFCRLHGGAKGSTIHDAVSALRPN